MSLLCRGYLRGTALMDVKGMWWFITGGNVRSALLWTVTARQCTEPSVTACKFRAFPEVIPVSALHLWGCRGCMLCNLVKGTVITRVKIRTRCAVSLRGASQWHKSSDGSEEDGAAGSSPLLLAKQNEWVGLVTKSLQSDSTLFFLLHVALIEYRAKFGGLVLHTRETHEWGGGFRESPARSAFTRGTNKPGWPKWTIRRRLPGRPGTAGWSGDFFIDGLITSMKWTAAKWGLICTAECVAQVGPITAPLYPSLSDCNRRRLCLGGAAGVLMVVMLTFSVPPPMIQQALRAKTVDVQN